MENAGNLFGYSSADVSKIIKFEVILFILKCSAITFLLYYQIYLHKLQMRLSVDGGWSDEVKQLTSSAEWLGNSFAYVGGAPHGRLYVPNHMFQFKGCMKKVYK